MMYDELLGSQTPAPKEKNAKPKQVKITDLFEMSNRTALQIVKNPALFCRYLDLQSRFDRYSVSNVLLLLAQKPEAAMIGVFSTWQAKEACIRKGEKAVYLTNGKSG